MKFSEIRTNCEGRAKPTGYKIAPPVVLILPTVALSKNLESGKPPARPDRQDKHDLLDKAVFATAQEARQFRLPHFRGCTVTEVVV